MEGCREDSSSLRTTTACINTRAKFIFKAYAESVGLRLESSAVDCWDNPISAGAHCSYLERDIQSRLNRYARDEDITDVWIWAEARSDGKYDLYIGYA